ncbi:hypothetical protein B0H13DRAFT_2544451 [Mycena leptocephala]|nr:hypothetical protein B0H13DRAFT_2544451 [Mycena leptocephala]
MGVGLPLLLIDLRLLTLRFSLRTQSPLLRGIAPHLFALRIPDKETPVRDPVPQNSAPLGAGSAHADTCMFNETPQEECRHMQQKLDAAVAKNVQLQIELHTTQTNLHSAETKIVRLEAKLEHEKELSYHEASERLHPSAVKSLRVLEIIRLVSLFLGVLTFSLELPTDEIPSTATWISTHEQVQMLISDEDITKNLGDTCVADWTGRVLWLQIHGQQPGDVHNSLVEQIIAKSSAIKFDKRPDTRALREKFQQDNDIDPLQCELSGDRRAVQIMHIIPLELGSGLFHELLNAVQTRAASHWAVMGDQLHRYPHDPQNPIIGNAALLPKSADLIDSKAQGSINTAKNLGVAAASIHWVYDKNSGVLMSTTPPFGWTNKIYRTR